MSDYCICHIENYWKELMSLSLEEFKQGEYIKAISYSKEALYRAEVLAIHPCKCKELQIPFAEIYILSYRNLAHIYQQIGDFSQAEKVTKQGMSFLGDLYKQKLLHKDTFER